MATIGSGVRRLMRAHPLRAIARRAWRARPAAAPSRAGRLASGVARRHGRAAGRHHRAAGLVLRHGLPARTAGVGVRATVHLAPRIALTIATAGGAPGAAAPSARSLGPEQRLVRRLASRGIRVESVAPSQASQLRTVPPAPRVVRRPSDAGDAAPAGDRTPAARTTRSDPVRHGATAPVGDAELGRLADRVVEAIDRRLVAQRERMGRR